MANNDNDDCLGIILMTGTECKPPPTRLSTPTSRPYCNAFKVLDPIVNAFKNLNPIVMHFKISTLM